MFCGISGLHLQAEQGEVVKLLSALHVGLNALLEAINQSLGCPLL
jgi:hypothetical protein